MKTKILLLLLLGWVGIIFAQKQVEIIINPSGIDGNIPSIKKRDRVKFKINNVNIFKINGTVESKPLPIDFDIPESFKNLTLQNTKDSTKSDEVSKVTLEPTLIKKIISDSKHYKKIDSISLQKILYNIKNANNTEEKENEQKQLEEDFIKYFSAFISNYNILQKQISLEDKIIRKIKKDSIFIKDTTVFKGNLREYFKSTYNNYSTEKAKVETEKILNELILDYAQLQKNYDEINKTLQNDSVTLSGELKSNDKKTTVKIEKAIVNHDRKKYFSEEMAFAKKAFEIISDTKNRNEIIMKAQAGIDLYNEAINNSFVVYTDAEQINSNESILIPKLKYPDGKVAHEFKPLTIKVRGGFKVNFSTGYLLSFIGNDDYLTKYNSLGNNVGVYKNDKNKITHAIGVLAHVLWDLNIGNSMGGFSSGISIDTDAKLNFYMGPSIAFLEKNRLILTGGLSFVNVKTLNRNNLDKDDNFINASNKDISYSGIYKPAIFFGVTYNLSSNSEEK
ncbi:hypothetical protein [Chryseobacterium gleum]|uniref:hypothetical protein n=1 Tax=Chryseobacterium gleum TaxID=250 RepID=UPI0031CF2526